MWQWRSQGPFRYLTWKPWVEEGFMHGFIGESVDFSIEQEVESVRLLREHFNLKAVLTLKQVHGVDLFDVSSLPSNQDFSKDLLNFVEADGFILPVSLESTGTQLGCGIRTADCVPLIIRTKDKVALIHAGWRGLAAGIIENAMECLQDSCTDSQHDKRGKCRVEVIIGPCAGSASYEVGQDVIDALGKKAVFQEKAPNKYLLDLEKTVTKILRQHRTVRCDIDASNFCTISDHRFFSHRRSPSSSGRNFSFVALSL